MDDTKHPAPAVAPVTADPWAGLRQFTDARIALGRCGSSLPLAESLRFRLDHARARDAVLAPFRREEIAARLAGAGIPCLELDSAVADRNEYLTRPDKGRTLRPDSATLLQAQPAGFDLCLVIADGLSSLAIHENAVPFARAFLTALAPSGLTVGPVCVVRHGRVAVADDIGALLQARLSVILIGERPGLSSPDSMGVYLTWNPRPGTTDEARNCISNVRRGGLPLIEGVRKLCYLVEEAFRMHGSGVGLKDRMPAGHLPFGRELQLPE
ncbi:ethanolamine ammonia-lyase subunit EutC [Megalodesulfovibrio gigas]|uniref:Ethanolamine ammonia-lyase small subunit n=1 Tax=Megalodesulfovibrio gigas (strain ATCC 19364 / DSM 1382 / NCIMB 9332 / VKM B-1759) TaxID=1121448 RepID=T2G943_MEGG1|nr:ethanolamine ammonia-lyase subunit EutC [Megalodesulfovibrio gigas]AGW12437.1 putative Ethanolamine ammonia-lyase [Megalodesulfovibrio gigas DSM 1382 = ATCC 19364]